MIQTGWKASRTGYHVTDVIVANSAVHPSPGDFHRISSDTNWVASFTRYHVNDSYFGPRVWSSNAKIPTPYLKGDGGRGDEVLQDSLHVLEGQD